MLNIKRGLPILLLAVLLALPLQAGAQAGVQDGKKRAKRPPLRARVVTDSKVGVPVVVAGQANSVVPVSPNVQILIEDGAAQPAEPELENWLVDGPPRPESWLNETAGAPATEPVAAPAVNESPQLVGVQHYMESTGQRPPPSPRAPAHGR